MEDQPELKRVYSRLAETEERHASFWEDRLRDAGVCPLATEAVLAGLDPPTACSVAGPPLPTLHLGHPRAGRADDV